ncbi:MAG: GNAT family N-acetyltransferase [Legionella sp.]|nr:GNAT family N-acetyltransferase [Legionella sp.]
MKLPIRLRNLKETDVLECIILFQNTIHAVNAKDYSPIQLKAWAPKVKPEITPRWKTLPENISYVAEFDNQIVGFGDLTKQGYLDRLFVHKDFQGQGIAATIVQKLEEQANELNLKEISTAASITAKPFFEKSGFVVMKEQQVEIHGVKLTNFVMRKLL